MILHNLLQSLINSLLQDRSMYGIRREYQPNMFSPLIRQGKTYIDGCQDWTSYKYVAKVKFFPTHPEHKIWKSNTRFYYPLE